jgi:hypothetical protein
MTDTQVEMGSLVEFYTVYYPDLKVTSESRDVQEPPYPDLYMCKINSELEPIKKGKQKI